MTILYFTKTWFIRIDLNPVIRSFLQKKKLQLETRPWKEEEEAAAAVPLHGPFQQRGRSELLGPREDRQQQLFPLGNDRFRNCCCCCRCFSPLNSISRFSQSPLLLLLRSNALNGLRCRETPFGPKMFVALASKYCILLPALI